MLKWFLRWQLRRRSRLFWELLQKEEYAAALACYERQLQPHEADLTMPDPAAYNLFRWIARRADEDAVAVRLLASGAEAGSAVTATWQTLVRFQFQVALAGAVSQRSKALPPAKTSAAGSPEEEATAALARAIMESFRLETATPKPDRDTIAQKVIQSLPRIELLPNSLRPVHAVLAFWALCSRQQFQDACQSQEILTCLPAERRTALQLGAVAARCWQALQRAVREGTPRRPCRRIAQLVSTEVCQTLALAWGLRAIESGVTASAVRSVPLFVRESPGWIPPGFRPSQRVRAGPVLFQAGPVRPGAPGAGATFGLGRSRIG